MIEIRPREQQKDKKILQCELFVDGELVPDESVAVLSLPNVPEDKVVFSVSDIVLEDLLFVVHAKNRPMSDVLTAYTWNELPANIFHLILDWYTGDLEFGHRISFRRHRTLADPDQKIEFESRIFFDARKWKRSWSIAEYSQKVASLAEDYGVDEVVFDDDMSVVIKYPLRLTNTNEIIKNNVDAFASIFLALHESAIYALESREPEHAVSMRFDFPDEVRATCEQYLVYFADFLKGVGVEATTDLTHHAGKVLFTVTPNNANEALDRIQEALALYLQLPNVAPSFAAPSPLAHSAEAQMLMAQVQQYQTNLMFVNARMAAKDAVIEAKNATIQAREAEIDTLHASMRQTQPARAPFAPNVLVDSITVSAGEEDKEKLLGGVIEATVWKLPLININGAEIVRKLTLLFSRRESPAPEGKKSIPTPRRPQLPPVTRGVIQIKHDQTS